MVTLKLDYYWLKKQKADAATGDSSLRRSVAHLLKEEDNGATSIHLLALRYDGEGEGSRDLGDKGAYSSVLAL